MGISQLVSNVAGSCTDTECHSSKFRRHRFWSASFVGEFYGVSVTLLSEKYLGVLFANISDGRIFSTAEV